MTITARLFTGTVHQLGGAVALGRVDGEDGAPLVQSDFGGIEAKAFNHATSQIIGTAMTLTPSAVILNALVTGDVRWKDSTGYNFLWIIPAATFPVNVARVIVEVKFSPSGAQPILLKYDLNALKTLS